MLVKSEILHWNCDCSLHLDVLCSTTIFTIQRLKPEWNFTQEKRKLVKGHHSVTISADVWLLRVHIIYCRMINRMLCVYWTFLCIKLLFCLFFFVWFFPCETTILWLAIQYESDVCRFCFLGLPYQRQEQLRSQLVFH